MLDCKRNALSYRRKALYCRENASLLYVLMLDISAETPSITEFLLYFWQRKSDFDFFFGRNETFWRGAASNE